VSDAFAEGRRFRILAVVDDFTRECLALNADTSLPGLRVVRELDLIIAQRGRPAMCVSDNGTELTGMAVLRWSQEIRIEWHYIAPGTERVDRSGLAAFAERSVTYAASIPRNRRSSIFHAPSPIPSGSPRARCPRRERVHRSPTAIRSR
jgi:transposase InsO family protein